MTLFELVAKLTLDSSEYEQGLDGARKNAESGGGKIGKALGTAAKIGAASLATGTAAVVAFGKSAVDAGSSFDTSMSQVAATMGKTTSELESEVGSVDLAWGTFSGNLREYAQEMGSNTAFSATEAADALNYMALAGYDTQTSMEMLPNVLNLAAAGGMELATASDMVTDAQSALGLSTDETTELVDKMAKASSKSNTSVQQLGDAMLTIGGTAKSLSGGTTELSQALGILADNGVKGAEGGTALRNILLNLTPQSKEAATAMEQLGLQAYDADGNMRPLKDIFQDLNKGLDGMTQEQRNNALASIFNKVDLKSVNALLDTNVQRWDSLAESIDNSQGAAAAMAETQLDNLVGDVTLFKSALEGAQIAVSDKLTPSLRDFVRLGTEGLSDITNAFNEEGFSGAIDAISQFVSDGLALIIDKLPSLVDAGAGIVEAVVQGIIDNIPMFGESAITIIISLAEKLSEALSNLAPAAAEIIITLADLLIEHLPELITVATDLIVSLASGLISALPQLVEKVPEIVIAIQGAILSSLPYIANAGKELIICLGKSILEYVTDTIDNVKNAGKKILDTLKSFFGINSGSSDSTVMHELGKNVGQSLVENFITAINDSIETIIEKANEIYEGIKTVFGNIIEYIKTTFSSGWNEAWENVKSLIVGVFEGIVSAVGERFNMIVDKVKEPINSVIGFLNLLIEKVEGAVNWIIDGFNRISVDIPPITVPLVGEVFGGAQFGVHIDPARFNRLEYLASGGILQEGERAIVGEYEPESLQVINGQAVVKPLGTGRFNRGNEVTINVYPQPGQSEEEIARMVERRFTAWQSQEGAAFA